MLRKDEFDGAAHQGVGVDLLKEVRREDCVHGSNRNS